MAGVRAMRKVKKYKKHFEVFLQENEKGKVKHNVLYKGEYYRYDGTKDALGRMKVWYGLLLIGMTGILVAMGLLNNPGSRRLEVTLPYVISFLPLVYAWLGWVRVLRAPERMTYVDYDKGYCRLKRSCAGTAVFGGLILLGEVIFWGIGDGEFSLRGEWLFALGGLLLSLLSLFFLRLQRIFPCISEKKI